MTGPWLSQLQKFFDVHARNLEACKDEFALNGYKAPEQPSYWTEPIRKRLFVDILTKLELSPEQNILDVGCGTGMILRQIAPHVAHVTGVDLSADMLAIARRYLPLNATLQRANAASLPFKDGAFDRVLCYHVITNFLDDDYTRCVLAQLVCATRKGGFVLIGNTPDDEKQNEHAKLIQQQWQGKTKPSIRTSLLRGLKTGLRNIWPHRIFPLSIQPSLSNRFYTKDFFRQFAKRTSCNIEILPLEVEGYIYAPCRFDVRLWPMQRS